MRKDLPRFTLRVSKVLMAKIGYMAEYSGRTKNKEIEYILKRNVGEFERLYGMPGLNLEELNEEDE